MDNEKLKILEMISEGKITPQEALELLKALEGTQNLRAERTEEDEKKAKGKPRWLYIKVEDAEEGKTVNIKIPFALARSFAKFVPSQGRHVRCHPHGTHGKCHVEGGGIDIDLESILETLSSEEPEDLVEIIEEGKKVVRIYTE